MENPLISVVIPTYKRKINIVARAVYSVLFQTYKNFEIIVVDDSPSDYIDSKFIERFLMELNDSRIKYVKHNVNKGANVARNTGIKKSRGKYIAFLDDDDQWLPTKLQKQLKMFDSPCVAMVYNPYYVYHKERIKVKKILKSGYLFRDLLYSNFIGSTSCVMLDKKKLLEVGLFNETLPASQDYELYLRISKKNIINFVDEPLVIYHEHNGERISSNPYKKLLARKYIYEKYNKSIKKYPWINSEKNLQIAHSYSQNKNFKMKWKHWYSAILAHPNYSNKLLKYTFILLLNK